LVVILEDILEVILEGTLEVIRVGRVSKSKEHIHLALEEGME
jgi:hypothetical protein